MCLPVLNDICVQYLIFFLCSVSCLLTDQKNDDVMSVLKIDQFEEDQLRDKNGALRKSQQFIPALSLHYNIKCRLWYNWVSNRKSNKKNQDNCGKPTLLEAEDGEALRAACRANESNSNPTLALSFDTNTYHQQVVSRVKRLKIDPQLSYIGKGHIFIFYHIFI